MAATRVRAACGRGGDQGTAQARVRGDPDARGAGRWSRSCTGRSTAAGASCWPAAARCRRSSTPAGCPTSWPRPGRSARRDWKVSPAPPDLLDRRVEITGPVDRKMVINALNSGAKVFMADFEDAHSPTWDATIEGQINLRDAIRGTIEFDEPRGQEVPPEQADGHAPGPAARLAPDREARHGRRPGRLRLALRLRPLPVPQRAGPAGQGDRARTSTCPSSRATSRPGSGTTSS